MEAGAIPGERSIYIDDFTDEVLPCLPTLEGWAAWLSAPSEAWQRDRAANDGEQFKASVVRWQDDIVATRAGGEWNLSSPIPREATVVAVRFAPGLGWSAENIISGEDTGAAVIEWLNDMNIACDDEEHIAIGFDEPATMLTFRADPARLVEDSIQ